MNKLQTIDDLKKMREKLRADLNVRENCNHPDILPQIRISMGTCGIAAGAKEIVSAFIDELNRRKIDAVVTQTGCIGYCNAEPTVEITLPGRTPVIFGKVTQTRVTEVIEKYILSGILIEGILPDRQTPQL